MQAASTPSATRCGAEPAAAACQSTPAPSIANQPDCPAAKPATPRISTAGAAGAGRPAVALQRSRSPSLRSANSASWLTPTWRTPASWRRGVPASRQAQAWPPASTWCSA